MLADGMDVVHACGVKPQSVTLIGGGARSAYWRQMLADISGQQLDYRTGGDVGPALGAAVGTNCRQQRQVAGRIATTTPTGANPYPRCSTSCGISATT